jgi:plastocyanin
MGTAVNVFPDRLHYGKNSDNLGHREWHDCQQEKLAAKCGPKIHIASYAGIRKKPLQGETLLGTPFPTVGMPQKSVKIRILGAFRQIECAAVHGCRYGPPRTLETGTQAGCANMEHLDIFHVARRRHAGILLALILAGTSAFAAEFEVTVLDRHGQPVPNVAVYIQSDHVGSLPAPAHPAVMYQIDSRFDPDLLIVQTGTRVQFPNNDIVAHHVYSFSQPNNFVLPMFKGNMRPQVEFEHAGIVAVGCNLHDHMISYILVVDSHAFGKTGRDGKVQLEADNQDGLTVSIWNPRLRLDDEVLAQTVKAGRSAQLTFLLTQELRAHQGVEKETFSWREN